MSNPGATPRGQDNIQDQDIVTTPEEDLVERLLDTLLEEKKEKKLKRKAVARKVSDEVLRNPRRNSVGETEDESEDSDDTGRECDQWLTQQVTDCVVGEEPSRLNKALGQRALRVKLPK